MTKILVIRLSSLGDVVLTIPVFRSLRQRFPEAHLTALVKEQYADVLAAEPSVDELIIFKKTESLVSLIRRVRDRRFDSVIDLHANIRSHIVSFFSRANQRVRYRKAALARRLYVGWRWTSSALQQHTLDRYMEALRPLGIERPIQNIIVIQTAFLGDAVLTTPLLGALHEKFPAARISVLCTPEIAEVFRHHPAVSNLLIFDKRGHERSWIARWRLVQRVQKLDFNVAIIPHRSLTSALIARLAGIPCRIGFSSSQGRWFLTDKVPFRWGTHDVERNLALLQPLGVQRHGGELWLRPEPSALESVRARMRQSGVGSGDIVLGINAGSVWATKRWLPEGFAEVADRAMRELGMKVLFLGSPRDRPTVDAITSRMKEEPLNWVGETTLRELIAAVASCNVFLTNDSGPMHLAVASQVPTVALFGPTTKELGFFPYGSGHHVIEKDLPCRPCGLHGGAKCPLGHFQCMKLITADEVFTAVREQLGNRVPESQVKRS